MEINRSIVKYAILQVITIPSIICDVLVLIYFIRHWRKEIIETPQNHIILCLLIFGFIQKTTDVPFLLYFLRWEQALIHTDLFCLIWTFLDYSTVSGSLHILTWCCIERHIFIFHGPAMRNQRNLILFHYIPMVVTLIYLPSFYVIVLFFHKSCTNTWNYKLPMCGFPCYVYDLVLGGFDWLFHCAFPTVLIIIINSLLLCRFIVRKVERQHPIRWNRQRYMIVQLVIISSLFSVLYFPLIIVGIVQTLWIPGFLSEIQYNYFSFFSYMPNQFLPFMIASQLPKFRRECYEWLISIKNVHRRRIQPHPSVTAPVYDNHIRIPPVIYE